MTLSRTEELEGARAQAVYWEAQARMANRRIVVLESMLRQIFRGVAGLVEDSKAAERKLEGLEQAEKCASTISK